MSSNLSWPLPSTTQLCAHLASQRFFFFFFGLRTTLCVHTGTTVTKCYSDDRSGVVSWDGLISLQVEGISFEPGVDFSPRAVVTDLDYSVEFFRTTLTCADDPNRGGRFSHDSTVFGIFSPKGAKLEFPIGWDGAGPMGESVVITFDADAASQITGGVPTTGSFRPSDDDFFDFDDFLGISPFGRTWGLFAGIVEFPTPADSTLCIVDFCVTVEAEIRKYSPLDGAEIFVGPLHVR